MIFARLSTLTALILLSGCSFYSPMVNTQHLLGQIEIPFDATQTQTTSATRISRSPISSSAITIQRLVAGAYDDETLNYRYMHATFKITNTSSNPFNNLSLYAYNQHVNSLGQTAIKTMINFGGTAITDPNVALAIQPMHGQKRNGSSLVVNPDEADFQAFSASEAQAVEDQALPIGEVLAGDDVLEYGFVARNSSGGRRIEAGASGTVTLTVRLPKPTNPALTPWKFVMTFVVVDDPVVRVTRGANESTAEVTTRASNLALNPSEVALMGSDIDTLPSLSNLRFPHVRLSSLPTYFSQDGAFTISRGYGKIEATNATVFAPRAPSVVNASNPVLYSISPDLQLNTGLQLNSSTGAISGTPTSSSTATLYMVSATDALGKISETPVQVTVNDAPALTGYADVAALKSTVIPTQTPTRANGTAPFVYSVVPALPTGLVLNALTGAINGTPSSSQVATLHTVTVTDANGATASATLNVLVRERLNLQYPSNPQATLDSSFTLNPAVSNVSGTVTYSVNPALPTGLVLNTSTGSITGIPTVSVAASNYSITATDTGTPADSTTVILNLTVKSQPIFSYPTTGTFTVGIPITINPILTGGASPLTYTDRSSSPLSSYGLSLTASGSIAGTPTAAATNQAFTIRVTDANGKIAETTVQLNIAAAPSLSGYSSVNVRLGEALPLQSPVVTGGVTAAPNPFSVDCLPALGFTVGTANTSTFRTDTGTLQSPSANTLGEVNCQVRYTDSNGAIATSSSFLLRVFQITGLSVSGVSSLVTGSSTTLTAVVTASPASVVSSGVTWSAECVLVAAGTACDAARKVSDYVSVNASSGVITAKSGGGAKVRIRATSNVDATWFASKDLTLFGVVTLPI